MRSGSPSSPPRRRRLRLPMEDGAELATEVVLPSGTGPWPLVLVRTYLGIDAVLPEAAGWARHGFACAVQDVRGRFASQGEWVPFLHEEADGGRSVSLLLAEPFCDGRIALTGASYDAFTACAAALSAPRVDAVIPRVAALRPVAFGPGGAGILPLLAHTAWWLTHGGTRFPRSPTGGERLAADPEVLRTLPVADLPRRLGVALPGWLEAAADPEAPPPLAPGRLGRLAGPALHVGGWHDPFVADTISLWRSAGAHAGSQRHSLLLGPWTHTLATAKRPRYGERDWGEGGRLPLGRVLANWLHHTLEGAGAGPNARFFLLGSDRWLEEDRWLAGDGTGPAAGLQPQRWFATPGGHLAPEPEAAGTLSFDYDPADPFPSRVTPLDEADLAGRHDVVRFETPPLEAPLAWVGPGSVRLWASQDAPSADWVVRLLEITPGGRSLLLTWGMIDGPRDLSRRGLSRVAGEVVDYRVELAPLAVRVEAGSRLRLEITGSAFPSYARNLGSGEDRLFGRRTRTVRQSVFLGPVWPTALELPCLARERLTLLEAA